MSVVALLTPRPPAPGPDGKPPGGLGPISWLVMLGLAGAVLAGFASYLATRLTSFALADLTGGFGVGGDEASWVANAYNVAEIAVVPIAPWLAGIVSPRRAIAFSIALLTVAGAACPSMPDYEGLVACRFLQGLGGGALIPLLLGTLLRFLPLNQRVVGFACYAFVTTATPLLAETLSGILTERLGWQAVYYLGILICPVSMMLVLVGLPVEPFKWQGLRGADYLGMALLALCASTLTTALDVGQRLDWFSSPLIVTLFVVSALLLAAFVLWELSIEKPLIRLRLLLGRNLICGLLLIFPFSLSLLVTSNVVAQYGIQVRGFRELQVGEVLIWAGLLQVAVCAAAPFLMRRIDPRVVLASGLALVAFGCRLATFIDSDWAVPDLLTSTLIVACGQPLIMVGLLLTATSVLTPQDALAGSILFNVVRTAAGSIGGAIVGGVLTVRERVHSSTLVDHVVAGAEATTRAGSLGSIASAAHVQATVMATSDAYGMLGLVALGGMGIALFINEIRIARPGRAVLASAALAMVLMTAAPVAHAADLDPVFGQALAEAYLTNPQLATERQRLREIDEGVPRALSGWRPTVRLSGSAGASAVFDNGDPAHQPERRLPQEGVLSVTQPLYTGGRVRAQVAQSEALVRAQRAALLATESSVLLAAATAYLDVARDQTIVGLNVNQSRVLEHSLRATEQANAAGAVTETDVAQARARLADQRSTTARAEGQLAQSRAVFEQQVGRPPGPLSVPRSSLKLPEGHDRILALVEKANFDLAEARLSLEASRQGVDIARAGLLPRISLIVEGERVKEIDVQLPHQRDNIAEGLLQLSVPLYQGGEVSAETRQAKEAARRTALQVDTVLRAVRQQAMTAMDLLAASQTRVAEQRLSIEANVVAERGISRQQAVGARTVLEVLNAQQELLAAQVNQVSALHDEYVAGLQLLAVTGGLTAAGLDLPVPVYDPEQHYKGTRDRWYGTDPYH